MILDFLKIEGLGNDFVVIDNRENIIKDYSLITRKLCSRRFGIGGDGVLFVENSEEADCEMIIYNADGSYAAMCGNGIRCFAKYVYEKKICMCNPITIKTGDGIKKAYLELENDKVKNVKINMGKESFNPKNIPLVGEEEFINKAIVAGNKEYKVTSLLMGVPHTVVLGALKDIDINEGAFIEKSEYFPEGTNVNFCEVINEEYIKVKTWERGAGATLACGTGSCACAVVTSKLGLTNNKVTVEVPGGKMIVEVNDNEVYMIGPCNIVFEGKIEI